MDSFEVGNGTNRSTADSSSTQSVFLPPHQTRLVTIAAHVDHGKVGKSARNTLERARTKFDSFSSHVLLVVLVDHFGG
jgi:hypothetical protein